MHFLRMTRINRSGQWTRHVLGTESRRVDCAAGFFTAADSDPNRIAVAPLAQPQATSSFHLHLFHVQEGFKRRFYFWPVRAKAPVRRSRGTRRAKKSATCSSSPWSHSPTLSSLHDVIGSMLGVLVQSLLHFPAVLADFYLSGLLEEEEKVDPDLESDDDEWHSFPQVQVRSVPPLCCQPMERSCQARPGAKTPPSDTPTFTPTPSLPGGNSVCVCVCVCVWKVPQL